MPTTVETGTGRGQELGTQSKSALSLVETQILVGEHLIGSWNLEQTKTHLGSRAASGHVPNAHSLNLVRVAELEHII